MRDLLKIKKVDLGIWLQNERLVEKLRFVDSHRLSDNWCRADGGNSSSGRSRCSYCVPVDLGSSGLRTFSRYVASLATAVASLSSSVQGAAVWCSTIAGNVTKLAACIALHSLSLAVTRKVVWPAALVASGSTVACKAAAHTSKATTGGRCTTTGACTRSRACTLEVCELDSQVMDRGETYCKMPNLAT